MQTWAKRLAGCCKSSNSTANDAQGGSESRAAVCTLNSRACELSGDALRGSGDSCSLAEDRAPMACRVNVDSDRVVADVRGEQQ